jgi:signal transduction histidine kinase/ActR/RegA family two-component response regulator
MDYMENDAALFKEKLAKERSARIKAEKQIRQLKKELEEALNQKNTIITNEPDVIFSITDKGEIITTGLTKKNKLFGHLINGEKPTIHSAFSEKNALVFDNALKNCLEKETYQFHFNQGKSNKTFYYETRLVKTGNNEVLAIVRDITPLKNSGKQLKEALKNAEEISRSKSEFLANVSHEIRTPLNAILGFSQWLFENAEQKQHREYLSTILESARNLLNLLNDLLDLSKIEAGKMEMDIHPMNYQEVINDIKLVFQEKVENKELSINVITDSSVPDNFFMDEIRFYQIIFNLVSNAVKFTQKGSIQISAHAQETAKKNRVNLFILIEDTGIGISEKQQKNIFETFTRQDSHQNREHEGTGLGLAIVNGLLKKLNGTITLKSSPEKGSVFTLTFFNVKTAPADNPRVAPQKEGTVMKLEPCKIMIVDDISYNKLVLKQIINSDQVTYIEENDGTSALAKLKTDKPEIIFMDIRMPGISGYDAAEAIKQDKDLKHIPLIAFTASTLKDHSKQIHSLFDGYLQKPVFKKDVDFILKKHLKFSYVDKKTEAG